MFMIRFIFTVARHTSMWKMRAPQMNRSPFQISGDPSTCGPGRVGEAWDGNHGHSSIHSSNISKTVTWSASFSPWPGTPLCERCARHKSTGHRFKSQVTHPKKIRASKLPRKSLGYRLNKLFKELESVAQMEKPMVEASRLQSEGGYDSASLVRNTPPRIPTSCSCGRPVKLHAPRFEWHWRQHCLTSRKANISWVRFLYGQPSWQKSVYSCITRRCWRRWRIGGETHNMEVKRFSKTTGIRSWMQRRKTAAENFSNTFPTWALCASDSLRSGNPQIKVLSRRGGGPWPPPRLARDQLERGVPIQTMSTVPLFIRPRTTCWKLRLVKSNWGPWIKSISTTSIFGGSCLRRALEKWQTLKRSLTRTDCQGCPWRTRQHRGDPFFRLDGLLLLSVCQGLEDLCHSPSVHVAPHWFHGFPPASLHGVCQRPKVLQLVGACTSVTDLVAAIEASIGILESRQGLAKPHAAVLHVELEDGHVWGLPWAVFHQRRAQPAQVWLIDHHGFVQFSHLRRLSISVAVQAAENYHPFWLETGRRNEMLPQ